ncbi:MAG: hypothetical protein QQW96_03905 [Tychonema bourrellyi B0820]|nr:hypothetical protein [Tychonema bourrellyi B0820]
MNESEKIEQDFKIAFKDLSQWLVQTRSLFQMVRKAKYTFAETEKMAKMLNYTLSKSGTKYNLVKNNKLLCTGNLSEILDYIFENLIFD